MNTALPLQSSAPVGDRVVLVAGLRTAVILSPGGEARHLPIDEAKTALRGTTPPILCHAPSVARRLGMAAIAALNVIARSFHASVLIPAASAAVSSCLIASSERPNRRCSRIAAHACWGSAWRGPGEAGYVPWQ